ncbi:MAG TPA: hypothetical protein VM939_08935 [Gemmatimonadaceae bacterium]|nr:hypothetical protein [Gemmatimonadaceae bacterium]
MTQPHTQLNFGSDSENNVELRVRPRRHYALPTDATPDEIREKLRTDIESRLMDVCSNWTTGEFDRIVTDVTETTIKFEGLK